MLPHKVLRFLSLHRTKKSHQVKQNLKNSQKIFTRTLRVEGLEERTLLTVCTAATQEALQNAIDIATANGGDGIVTFESDMVIGLTNSDDSSYENAALVLTKDVVIDGSGHNIKLTALTEDLRMIYVGRDWNLDHGANVTLNNLSMEGYGSLTVDNTYAIKVVYASASIKNVSISNFKSVDTLGTICVTGDVETSLIIEDSTIYNNSMGGGGAINASGSYTTLKIKGGSIYNCSDTFSWGGGGLRLTGGVKAEISGTNLNNLKSEGPGGAIYIDESELLVDSCVFANNTAAEEGGAIYSSGNTTIKLLNSSLYANSTVMNGGALYMDGVQSNELLMTNCTLVGNSAVEEGGGLYIETLPANITCVNCIVYDNNGGNLGGVINTDNFITSYVSPGSSYRGSFAFYSGDKTDYENWDLTPINAPFIDAGNNISAVNMHITTDVNGYPRFSSTIGNDALIANVDMGAYEFQQYLVSPTITSAACSRADFSDASNPKAVVTLVWESENKAPSYTISYKETLSESWTEIDVGDVLTYDISLSMGQLGCFYDFKIQANNQNRTVKSAWSNPIRVDIPGEEIIVSTTSDVVNPNDGQFSLRESLETYGSYNPGATITLTNQETYTLSTILGEIVLSTSKSINGNGATVSGNNTSRILNITNNADDINIAIENITFQNGNAINGSGGAIILNGTDGKATLSIGNTTSVTFTSNHAEKIGGALFAMGNSAVNIEKAVFQSNSAVNGGAIGNFLATGTSTPNMIIAGNVTGDVVFNNNSATRFGGAYFGSGCAIFQNTDFGSSENGNEAQTAGAIYNETRNGIEANVTLDHCKFNFNKALGNDNLKGLGNGGAIANWGVMHLTDCEFGTDNNAQSGNSALFNGGAILNGTGGTMTLTNSRFQYNKIGSTSVNGFGGAINNTGTLTINGSTEALGPQNLSYYRYNEATCNGGAIANSGTITFDTTYDCISITNNTAKLLGGGIVSTATLTFSGTSYKTTMSANVISSPLQQNKGRNIANGNGSQIITSNDINWTGDADAGIYNYTYQGTAQIMSCIPIENLGLANSSRVLADENRDGIFEEVNVISTYGLNIGENNVPIKLLYSDGNTSDAVVALEVIDIAPTIAVTTSEFANSQLLRLDFEVIFTTLPQTWNIHWGDGTSSETMLYVNELSTTHYYAAGSSYDITLELIDPNGGEGTTYFVTKHKVPAQNTNTQTEETVFSFDSSFLTFTDDLVEEPQNTTNSLENEIFGNTSLFNTTAYPQKTDLIKNKDIRIQSTPLFVPISNDIALNLFSFDASQPFTLPKIAVDEAITFLPLIIEEEIFADEENDFEFLTSPIAEHEAVSDFVESEILPALTNDRLKLNSF